MERGWEEGRIRMREKEGGRRKMEGDEREGRRRRNDEGEEE